MKTSRLNAFKRGRKMRNDIFFNKKRRVKLKKNFLEGQKLFLQTSDFSVKPLLKEEYAKRAIVISALAFTVTGLETVKKAEDFEKETYLTNCKFYLFRKAKSAIIKATFLKPLLDNSLKTTFIYFPQGLPKGFKKKAFVYKDKFEFEGYNLLDTGTFKQKMVNFEEYRLNFKGKKIKLKINLKIINLDKHSYWITELRK